MFLFDRGLRIHTPAVWLDSRRPRACSFVSHAHTDHLAQHEVALASAQTIRLAARRIGLRQSRPMPWDRVLEFDRDTQLTALHAGHVLGSAMLYVRRPEGSLLYTGDFKLRASLTCPVAQPCRADVLVMESTFGLPYFRFPPWRGVADHLIDLCRRAMQLGSQPIVLGYSLGKAQEATRILTTAGLPVTEHGAVAAFSDLYESLGVPLGPRRRYDAHDFHGRRQLPLEERGVLVAPPQVARAAFAMKFERSTRIMLSGWALQKGAIYRYGVDHALPLSDHADFDELLRLIEIVRPRRVYCTHGFPAFVDHLRYRGIDAHPAEPDPQLRLFEPNASDARADAAAKQYCDRATEQPSDRATNRPSDRATP